jgi:hypothetical protein
VLRHRSERDVELGSYITGRHFAIPYQGKDLPSAGLSDYLNRIHWSAYFSRS